MSDRNRKKNYYNKGGSNRRKSHKRYKDSRQHIRLRGGSIIYLLDILQHGGVDKKGHSWQPICQVFEIPSFRMYEMTLNKKKISDLKLQMKLTVTNKEDSPLKQVNKRLKYDDLTPASEKTLEFVIGQYVLEHEERFLKFINNVGSITIKRHYLEILPGVGKKLMRNIIDMREIKPFESFEELHNKVRINAHDVFVKRILEELENIDIKHHIFVKLDKKKQNYPNHSSRKDHYRRRH